MPATIHDTATVPLLALVDFKWLMAGEGHRVSTDRLCQDRVYAKACLALASGSASPTLRHSASQLALRLDGLCNGPGDGSAASTNASHSGASGAPAAMGQGASGP